MWGMASAQICRVRLCLDELYTRPSRAITVSLIKNQCAEALELADSIYLYKSDLL